MTHDPYGSDHYDKNDAGGRDKNAEPPPRPGLPREMHKEYELYKELDNGKDDENGVKDRMGNEHMAGIDMNPHECRGGEGKNQRKHESRDV
jgi:hypothetical protein